MGAGRTVLEVLQDFKSAQVPLEWLLQTVPHLKPRQFSIASSLSKHPNSAHILVAVVDYKTPFKRRKQGLCSSWLASLTAFKPSYASDNAQGVSQASALQDGGVLDDRSTHAALADQRDGLSSGGVSSADGGEAASRQHGAQEPSLVPVWVERGVLRLPASHSAPMILVGPGTGVAPFRSFLQERQMAAAGLLLSMCCFACVM